MIQITQDFSADELAKSRLFPLLRVNRSASGGRMSDRRFVWRVRKAPEIECQFSMFSQKPNRIGFSRSREKGYFSSRTIPYAGIQLAYYLGFSKVFWLE